jgi:hypothetical protein
MYTASAQQLAKGALQDLGMIALGQELNGPEGASVLELLNLVVDAMSVDRGLLFSIVRTTETLVSGTPSYTVGSGGDIDIVRPLWIARAGLIQDTGASVPTEIPIAVLSKEQFADWPRKTEQSSQSRAIWYDHAAAAGLGAIYPLPIPNAGTTQLVLYTPGGQVSQFAEITTEYAFAPGYALMVRRLLADALVPMYPQASAQSIAKVQQSAASIRRQIQAANTRPVYRENSPFLNGGGQFDIDAGYSR